VEDDGTPSPEALARFAGGAAASTTPLFLFDLSVVEAVVAEGGGWRGMPFVVGTRAAAGAEVEGNGRQGIVFMIGPGAGAVDRVEDDGWRGIAPVREAKDGVARLEFGVAPAIRL